MNLSDKAASILIGMVLCSNANALTGNDLHEACLGELGFVFGFGSFGFLSCESYVAGVADAMTAPLCFEGDGIPYDQLSLIVKKHLTDHPEKLHKEASDLVIEALTKAFPCN